MDEKSDEEKVEVRSAEIKVTDLPKATVFQVCQDDICSAEISLAKSTDL